MRIPIVMFAIAAIALATAWDCVLAADNNGVVPTYPQDPLPLQGRTSDMRLPRFDGHGNSNERENPDGSEKEVHYL
jgi:hypothetical protein